MSESIYELRYKSFISNDVLKYKIHLYRTYSLVPQDVGKFMALSKDKFHLRTKHSVLLGKIGNGTIALGSWLVSED